jgi:hypothetical protein
VHQFPYPFNSPNLAAVAAAKYALENYMEKLSGLVLDFADDHDGEVLRSIYPTRDEVPEQVKTASVLRGAPRDQLPDDLFALVLNDGDVTLRKFACADAGNTILSVDYFLRTGHKLPEEAQKVAASNLCTACGWYGLEAPEELKKVAGIGAVLGATTALMETGGAVRRAKSNLQNARAAGGRVDPTVTQLKPWQQPGGGMQ